MSLRIAHVTATFPPYRGGTGNVCYYNARELARRGHDVHVFTAALPGAPAEELREGVAIHRLHPLLRVGNAPVLPGLLRVLRGFDVIHLHYPFFGGEITTLAAKLNRSPLVITYHQDVLLDGLMGLIATALRITIGRLTLRTAARVLFTSQDYGQASYVRALLSGREQRVDELPNGVDTTIFAPDVAPVELRARHGIVPENQVVLLVASLDRAHYFKGVNIFLAAMTQLPPSVKGIIVGDGDLRPIYEATAEELGVRSRIVFAGRVADKDLPNYYRLADVTVLPSTTMGEAFGLVLVESLASGTPAIASCLPGVRTVVEHGYDGLLVPPGNSSALTQAIERILDDGTLRQRMGQYGHTKVEARYSWNIIGDRLEEMYQQVLAEAKVPVRLYIQGGR